MSNERDQRNEALKKTLEDVHKRFGDGVVMRLGDQTAADVDVVPTGSLALDRALGIGGYPRGRVVEIYGPEASGKTTLTLHAIAEVQRMGGTAAFVDAEHALDVSYARALGVDVDSLLVSQPDDGEQALEVTEALVRSGAVDLLVVDSVAALTPRAEIEGDMGDQQLGLQARLMSKALRKLTAITSRTGCLVLFINQVRQKIGVTFGSNEVTTGGNALKFYASVRLDIRRIGSVKAPGSKGEHIGNKTRVKIVKNKLAPPFRSVEFEILYGRGVCRAGEVMNAALDEGAITQNGAWFNLGEERLGQGRERVREKLMADPALLDRVMAMVTDRPADAK
jgi:recombination protein RecA